MSLAEDLEKAVAEIGRKHIGRTMTYDVQQQVEREVRECIKKMIPFAVEIKVDVNKQTGTINFRVVDPI